MAYKHGIYGEQVPSGEIITTGESVPVYIGTAPVHTLEESTGSINVPLLISDEADAIEKLGYSADDDFSKYTLSAAVYAHFSNGIKPIGPIVVINVYDPVTHTTIDDVDSVDIVGNYDAATEERTGIKVLDLVYEELNLVPSIISAPGFNHIPSVEVALKTACSNISGRWDTIYVTDIDSTTADTIAEAKTWKTTNGYNSKLNKTCWPRVKMGEKILWMSILAIVRTLQTDDDNDGIPYETPSNKQLDITGLIVGTDKALKLTITQGNSLNEDGITTSIYNGGRYVLWGPHMANYKYGTDIAAEDIFDVNIRMNLYLLNDFKVRYAYLVDSPIDRNDVDSILNTEQIKLNSLISDGKLLYGAITFNPKNNLTSDLVQGDFAFDTAVTNTPPGKSLTNRIQYTSTGLSTLVGGDS